MFSGFVLNRDASGRLVAAFPFDALSWTDAVSLSLAGLSRSILFLRLDTPVSIEIAAEARSGHAISEGRVDASRRRAVTRGQGPKKSGSKEMNGGAASRVPTGLRRGGRKIQGKYGKCTHTRTFSPGFR
jgi:hypothetical protein